MSIANLLTLLGLLAGVVASAWTVYNALVKKLDAMDTKNDEKIKRVYERQDEKISQIEKDFMRVDAHNLSMEHIKEVMEIKSNSTIQLFTTRLDNLSNNVKELIDRVNHRDTGKSQ